MAGYTSRPDLHRAVRQVVLRRRLGRLRPRGARRIDPSEGLRVFAPALGVAAFALEPPRSVVVAVENRLVALPPTHPVARGGLQPGVRAGVEFVPAEGDHLALIAGTDLGLGHHQVLGTTTHLRGSVGGRASGGPAFADLALGLAGLFTVPSRDTFRLREGTYEPALGGRWQVQVDLALSVGLGWGRVAPFVGCGAAVRAPFNHVAPALPTTSVGVGARVRL